MTIDRAGRPRPFGPTLLLAALLAAGCGGNRDRAAPVKAEGTVTYQGEPLEFGFVQFVPEDGRPASGPIGPDGRFRLTTYDREGDGAIPGRHKVGVIVTEAARGPGPEGEDDNDDEQITRYIVPQKYANALGSGITVEIPPEGKTDIVIAID